MMKSEVGQKGKKSTRQYMKFHKKTGILSRKPNMKYYKVKEWHETSEGTHGSHDKNFPALKESKNENEEKKVIKIFPEGKNIVPDKMHIRPDQVNFTDFFDATDNEHEELQISINAKKARHDMEKQSNVDKETTSRENIQLENKGKKWRPTMKCKMLQWILRNINITVRKMQK